MLAALHLAEPSPESLARLREREWRDALDFCGRSQITLAFRRRFRDAMPAAIGEIADGNLAHNRERLALLEALYRLVAQRLGAVGIEFLALKGLPQCPEFGSQPEDRPQYDVDLFTTREAVFAARDALAAVGFEPMEGMENFPTDHIPALIRKTGWQWRGDVFDPEMPIAVELHFRFWNPDLECLPAPGVEEFWRRRVVRRVAGVELRALCPQDALGYASLHLLKHVLQGATRPFHVYEVACFLESHAADEDFWKEWRALHGPELRRLQAAVFGLAQVWFGCRLGAAGEEVERLPAGTRKWFEKFGTAPAEGLFTSNKDELWLHLSLLDSRRDGWRVARRRLFPGSLPGPVDAVHIAESEIGWSRRGLRQARWLAYVLRRVWHHAAALVSLTGSGLRWWWGR